MDAVLIYLNANMVVVIYLNLKPNLMASFADTVAYRGARPFTGVTTWNPVQVSIHKELL